MALRFQPGRFSGWSRRWGPAPKPGKPARLYCRCLALSDGTVRVAVHRLRQRYRELLRAVIGQTVASADEVDAEMQHVFNVLAQAGR